MPIPPARRSRAPASARHAVQAPSGSELALNISARGHCGELEGIIGASIRSVKPAVDSTNPGSPEGSRRGDFGAEKGQIANKNREKSQKNETSFEALLLILNMVIGKNRFSECIKSLPWFFRPQASRRGRVIGSSSRGSWPKRNPNRASASG